MKYFGTDGFRGEAGGDLTAEQAFRIGRFLGWYFGRNVGADAYIRPRDDVGIVPYEVNRGAKIVIGKDTRRSSYMFEYALAAGITASGGDAYLLHVTTTPSVAFVVKQEGFDCGVVISASHNVFSDNGIKLLNRNGEKMEEEVLEKIEGYIDLVQSDTSSVTASPCHLKVNCRKAARETTLGCLLKEKALGSDGSAAGGGRSDLSEWQRSADAEVLCHRRQMQGTATGGELIATSPAAPRNDGGRTEEIATSAGRETRPLQSRNDKGRFGGVPFAKGSEIGRTVDYVAGRNRYVGYLISLGMFSFKGLKVGLDCANGAAFSIAPAVFEALGAKVYGIGCDPDGTNINDGCGSTHPEKLQQLVKKEGLDVGFAFDGDADRCLAVDENGELFDGDHILYALGQYMQASPVVTTVMSNLGLYKAFDRLGIDYAKTAVGDKYVYAYMAEHGCALGGEQSGHIIISKYATTGDGILTSLKLMECMLAQKKKLSELKKGLEIFPQVLESVRVGDKEQAMAAVESTVEEIQQELGENGRILVRASGTEPVIRVMVEADSEKRCRELVERVIKKL